MVAEKLASLSPNLREEVDEQMKKFLCDKDPCVMATTLNYFGDVCKADPIRYKNLISSFVVILKQVIENKLPKDFSYHRMPAPWIQIKILSILSFLGQYDQSASEEMYKVLEQVLRRADDIGINIGYAIVYQCLNTICTIYPSEHLIELASKTISRFIVSDSRNLKYIGITGLARIVQINPKYALTNQEIIVNSMEDQDMTIRSKLIDLLFRMANTQNAKVITERLMNYLAQTTGEANEGMRKDLVNKIYEIAEKLSPGKAWYIQTINQLFQSAGELITMELTHNYMRLISEWEDSDAQEYREYTLTLYTDYLRNSSTLADPLMQVIAYLSGEYAPAICKSRIIINQWGRRPRSPTSSSCSPSGWATSSTSQRPSPGSCPPSSNSTGPSPSLPSSPSTLSSPSSPHPRTPNSSKGPTNTWL